MKKKIAAVAAAGALLLGLSACGTESEEPRQETPEFQNLGDGLTVKDFPVKLSDGRTVSCVYVDGFKAGGPSCDWENAK